VADQKIQFWDKLHRRLRTVIVKDEGEVMISDLEYPANQNPFHNLDEEIEGNGADPAGFRILFEIRNELKGLDSLIMYLYFFSGWSYNRIAAFLSCSSFYIFSRMQKIKEIISQNEECRKLWGEVKGKNKEEED